MTARVALPMLPGLSSATPLREADDDAYRPMDPALEEAIVREMADIYLMGMAVIDGFSGGKDSNLLLALRWKALRRVQERMPERLTTPVFVLIGDTGTENPILRARTMASAVNIRAAARRDGLPIYVEVATPRVADLLLVRIIGHGYPAPTQVMRWCVERLKSGPSARAVDRLIGRDTPAVFTMGTRKGESIARKRAMDAREVAGACLQPNPARPGSYTHEPLAEVGLGEVWHFLETTACPWNDVWWDLSELYRQSSDVCPVQVPGTSRNTCGNSRHGCWACTVVKNEKSLRNMAAGVAPWMRGMVAFRDLLYETTQGEARLDTRSIRGGEGETINLTGKGSEQGGSLSPRGYTMAFRKRLLADLLEAEDEARRLGPDPAYTLIEDDALREIQRVWEQDWGDWERSAVDIARSYRGDEWALPPHPRLAPRRHVPGWPPAPCRKLLVQDTAYAADLPPLLLWRFVDIVERFRGDPTYRGLSAANRRLAELMRADWRSDGVIVADLLWERAAELAGEEDRRLQATERVRLSARSSQPALFETGMSPPPPPPTQADAIVAEIMDTLRRDPGVDMWALIVRAPRHGAAPPLGARRVRDDDTGAIAWGPTRWFDRPGGRKDLFLCRDGSYGYVSEIYGAMQGAAKHWVSYPPARDYVDADRPPAHVVLGKRAARYRAAAYLDGRWRRAVYDRTELCWVYVDQDNEREGYTAWHAEPLKTANHAALRLERRADDDPWFAPPPPR